MTLRQSNPLNRIKGSGHCVLESTGNKLNEEQNKLHMTTHNTKAIPNRNRTVLNDFGGGNLL